MVGRDKLTPMELEMRLKIADELNRLKNEKELTQQDIVKESGISQSTLSQYFSGKRLPSKTNSKKLADFFKVPVELQEIYRSLFHYVLLPKPFELVHGSP